MPKKSSGKRALLASITLLLVALACLFSGILFSLPSRAEELFGPPQPDLSLDKLYIQSLLLVLSEDQLRQPVFPQSTDFIYPINSGDSLDKILSGLIQLGLVKHGQAFRAYLIYSGLDTRIQPGEYQFSSGMTELEIADLLGNPQPTTTTLTILAGWRAEEIGESLLQLGFNISSSEFMDAVRAGEREGYLFPGSYNLKRELPADKLVDLLYQNFISQISPELENRLTNQGLTLHQAVILSSIIEREAVLEQEMPLIASVFLNRLQNGINLAADPTVQYALGYNTIQGSWWTNPLSLDDLKLPSPYNTYENPGLPPGPISNPGYEALLAVANPADTNFLYFRASCDGSGSHSFAETFEEHLANACQ
jgi:UPF0755 protein